MWKVENSSYSKLKLSNFLKDGLGWAAGTHVTSDEAWEGTCPCVMGPRTQPALGGEQINRKQQWGGKRGDGNIQNAKKDQRSGPSYI